MPSTYATNKDGRVECWKNGMIKTEWWNVGTMEYWVKNKESGFIEHFSLKPIIPLFHYSFFCHSRGNGNPVFSIGFVGPGFPPTRE
jgi:hypothetical protein